MNMELARRIAFTIGALLVFRLGSNIPVTAMWTSNGPLPPGSLARISIFALNLIPYFTAAVVIQLVAMVWGRLRSTERSGEARRRTIAGYTLILTLLLAAFQAYGLASAIQNISGLVDHPDGWFLLSASASMVGGVFFLVWLSELINRYGIGNGLALMLCVNILVGIPADVATVLEMVRQGVLSGGAALLHAMFWVAVVAAMVVLEAARRNLPVAFAPRQLGMRLFPASASVLPIKLNNAGLLIPVSVTLWLFSVPLALAAFIFGHDAHWIAAAYEHLQYARPTHLILGSLVLFVLVFVYTANVLDPEHVAEALQKRGGVISGVEPGEPTADYLDRMVSLTTVVGAVYLVAVSLIPEALVACGVALPYKISGGAVLIVVCTVLDLKMQVRDVSLTNPGGVRQ